MTRYPRGRMPSVDNIIATSPQTENMTAMPIMPQRMNWRPSVRWVSSLPWIKKYLITPQTNTRKASVMIMGTTIMLRAPMMPVVPLPTNCAKVMSAGGDRRHGRLDAERYRLRAEQDKRPNDGPEERLPRF